MIVQHPFLWCAVLLAAGIATGFSFPLPCYLPLLAASVVACTLLRRGRHLHDVLTLLVWFLLGCSRAALCPVSEARAEWQQTAGEKAKAVRERLTVRLQAAGISPRTLALCSALTIGRKDGLEHRTRRAYSQVGVAHLLALSGMHLGIIYGFLYFLFVRSVQHTRMRWFSLPVILLCLWGYTWIAGMPVSLLRAATMLSILTVSLLMQHNTDPLHPLALSAVIILLIAPADLLSISFQLSFAAVFFLLALWTPMRDRFPRLPWAVRVLAVSCIASLGTMPLTLHYFHQLPLLGPLLSLLLIPLTTLIIYLTLAAMLLPVAPTGWLLDHAVALQQGIIDLAAGIPGGTLTGIHLDAPMVVLIYGALVIAIVRTRSSKLLSDTGGNITWQ